MLKSKLFITLCGGIVLPVITLRAAAILEIAPAPITALGYADVAALSSDGSTIVGSSFDSNFTSTGFLWKVGSTPVTSTAVATSRINADGSNSFGVSQDSKNIVTLSSGGASTTITGPAGVSMLALLAASDDGSTFLAVDNPIDFSKIPRPIWKYSGGSWTKLGEINGYVRTAAIGNELVSASTYDTDSYAASWTVATGMQNLPKLDGTIGRFDEANYINPTGTLLCGSATDASDGKVAALWKNGQIYNLGGYPDSNFSTANAVAEDGATWVGTDWDGMQALIGKLGGTAHSLEGVLKGEYGLDLGDYTLASAKGISADGLKIAGIAMKKSDNTYNVFRVTLPYALPVNPATVGEPVGIIFDHDVYDVGGDWVWGPTLGFMYTGNYPFVWMDAGSSWIYIFETAGATDAGFFIYDFKSGAFGWTGYAYYPSYFAFGGANDGQWVRLVP
ncbi:MAG: hypothetical protein SFY80_13795 [Verrucomicrobiota bacterium]|nr:hypothetical protein [Verrucomicrobiota bacterium]